MELNLSENFLPLLATVAMWVTFAIVWVKTRDI
jgi:hypothetical protein